LQIRPKLWYFVLIGRRNISSMNQIINTKWQAYLKTVGHFDETQNSVTFCEQKKNIEALEEKLNIIPLTQLAFIKVSGADALSFLNGQLTCDLSELSTKRCTFGAHCSAKGKVQNFYRICHYPDDNSAYLLILQKDSLNSSLKLLKKYSLFSEVNIEDVSQILAAVCLHGNQLSDFLKDTLNEYNSQDINHVTPIPINSNSSTGSILQLRGKINRILLVAPVEALITFWQSKLTNFFKLNSNTWELLEIRAGIPIIYPETTNCFFPHYLNLPTIDAVSFNKGCYIGQEVITRMQFRGKSNKHMHRAFIEVKDKNISGLDLVGQNIVSIQNQSIINVGTIIVCSPTQDNQYELLTVIHNQYQNFMNLFVNSADEPRLHHLDLSYN